MIEPANYAIGMSRLSRTPGICGAHTTSPVISGGKKCTRLLTPRAADASPRGSPRNYLVLACAANASRSAALAQHRKKLPMIDFDKIVDFVNNVYGSNEGLARMTLLEMGIDPSTRLPTTLAVDETPSVQPTLLQCDFTDCNEEVRHIMCSRHYDESQSG